MLFHPISRIFACLLLLVISRAACAQNALVLPLPTDNAGHVLDIRSLWLSADGKRAWTQSDGELRFWDTESNAMIRSLTIRGGEHFYSPAQAYLKGNGALEVALPKGISSHHGLERIDRASPKGRYVHLLQRHGGALLWDSLEEKTIPVPRPSIHIIGYTPDEQNVIARESGRLALLKLPDFGLLRELMTLGNSDHTSVSLDGVRIIITDDGSMYRYFKWPEYEAKRRKLGSFSPGLTRSNGGFSVFYANGETRELDSGDENDLFDLKENIAAFSEDGSLLVTRRNAKLDNREALTWPVTDGFGKKTGAIEWTVWTRKGEKRLTVRTPEMTGREAVRIPQGNLELIISIQGDTIIDENQHRIQARIDTFSMTDGKLVRQLYPNLVGSERAQVIASLNQLATMARAQLAATTPAAAPVESVADQIQKRPVDFRQFLINFDQLPANWGLDYNTLRGRDVTHMPHAKRLFAVFGNESINALGKFADCDNGKVALLVMVKSLRNGAETSNFGVATFSVDGATHAYRAVGMTQKDASGIPFVLNLKANITNSNTKLDILQKRFDGDQRSTIMINKANCIIQ